MKRSAFLVFTALLAAGCGDDSATPLPPDLSAAPRDMAVGSTGGDLGQSGDLSTGIDASGGGTKSPFTVVVTVLLENHDYNEIVGNTTDAPYINGLIAKYGLATNYMDSGTHPSLPNYIYMVNGQFYAPFTSDDDVSTYLAAGTPLVSDDNLGNQLQKAHVPWRGYFESMYAPCQLTDSGNRKYAARHNPFIYFTDILNAPNHLCDQVDVDYSLFDGDLASGAYKYMWISPDAWSDGHGVLGNEDFHAMLKVSDDWCATHVQAIIDSPTFKAGGVIFLTWDEAKGRPNPSGGTNSADQVPMIIISPKIKSPGFTSNKPYNHASYLATMEDLFGLPRLGAAVGAQNMMEFFTLP
jgi:hypothetical protein